MAKLSVVGIGPGSPDYVTPAARKSVRGAELVVGAERSLSLMKSEIRGVEATLTARNMNELLELAVAAAEEGKEVAILSTGDPGFSGLLRPVARHAQGRRVDLCVIPGISSIQACAARLCMSWEDAGLFSLHRGAPPEKWSELARTIKEGRDIIVLPDQKASSPREIVRFLLSQGLDRRTPVFVCESITLRGERIVGSTLENASELDFDPLCVVVVKGTGSREGS
ncbi:MAG: precorrin-6y C5,15-methyltransferase (decarboxylating) subunit CbiE [Candidatus Verstraetearchaeota archaeon]|nr:precorrin-6y C5,15-methyltransferase (decarboxylating) subunit CbiE [Candidatus Verstraetearchaeota archaeon]